MCDLDIHWRRSNRVGMGRYHLHLQPETISYMLDARMHLLFSTEQIRAILTCMYAQELSRHSNVLDLSNMPAPPETKKVVPRGKGPDKTRNATFSDVSGAIMGIPLIDSLVTGLRDDTLMQLQRGWAQMPTGERVGAVTFAGVTGLMLGFGGTLGLLGSESGRRFVGNHTIPLPHVALTIHTGSASQSYALHGLSVTLNSVPVPEIPGLRAYVGGTFRPATQGVNFHLDSLGLTLDVTRFVRAFR